MTVAKPQNSSISYPRSTVLRAERAVRCSPFRFQLFAAMGWQGVSLRAIAGSAGVQNQYTRQPLPELAAEDALLWLIQVGVLRREVDGQGLTDSFRLTPLGRQLVQGWNQAGKLPAPSASDRIYNVLSRWVRLPSWLQ